MQVLNLAVRLALLLLTGLFIRKIGLVDKSFQTQLSKFLMNVCLPCLIINSLNVDFSRTELLNCAVIMGVAVIVLVLLFVLGQAGFLLFKKTSYGRVLRYGTVFPNFTFFGMPVAESLYGAQGLFYFTVLTLPIRLAYYSSAGILLGGKHEKKGAKTRLKEFFSAPIIGVLIGLLLFVTQLELPQPLTETIAALGSITSPLGMVLCGLILGDVELKGLLGHPSMFALTLFKNFLAPALVLLVLMLLPVDELIIRVAIIYCAAPVASLLSMFTLRYTDGDTQAAAQASANTFTSTMLAVLTLPLWSLVLDLVLA